MKEEDGGGRVLVRVKSNLGPDGGGFKYELKQEMIPAGMVASRVEWCGPIDGSARDILASAEQEADSGEHSERSEATDWLRGRITDAGGEMNRREILADANAAGFSERTIDRARSRAGITVQQSGFGNAKRSVWRIDENSIPPQSRQSRQGPNVGGDGGNSDANGAAAEQERSGTLAGEVF